MSDIEVLKIRMQELLSEGNLQAANAIQARINDLTSQNNVVPEKVTAEPMTQEQDATFDGVTFEDEQYVSKKPPLTAPATGLQTPAPIAPDPMEETPDETEQLMSEYRKSRDQYQSDVDKFDQDREVSEASRQRMTGIAGALSAFGEGLATITGGSAKPLQAGVAAVKSIGEQQATSEERKAKTLKERLQMAKAPLEEKQTEIDLRSRLSKGKMERDIMDPASQQSAQARKDAGSFIDNMIAQGTANKASPNVMQRLEQTKSLIGQMSAAQVQQFYNTLKPLSIETSVDAKNQFEMQTLAAQENIKLKLADAKDEKDREKIAFQTFKKDADEVRTQSAAASSRVVEVKKFRDDLRLALSGGKGSKEAGTRISQMGGIINYLNARTYEDRGVFTDNDLKNLSVLQPIAWADQFNKWVKRGLDGTEDTQSFSRMLAILDETVPRFENAPKYTKLAFADKYKTLYNVSGLQKWKDYEDEYRNDETKGNQQAIENKPSATEPEDPVAKLKRLQTKFGNKVPPGGQ